MNLEEAYNLGWRSLKDSLPRVADRAQRSLTLERTFVLWRTSRLVPPAIQPQRGWLRGRPTVLWPPELQDFLRDAVRFRGYAHMRGQRVRGESRDVARSHASLRILLWVYGWDYPLPLVRRSILHIAHQAARVISTRNGSPLDFLRWFFLSSKAFAASRFAAVRRRTERDAARERAFESFKTWAGVVTWAEFDLLQKLRGVDEEELRSFKQISRGVRQADERLFEVARGQAQRLVKAVFPQSAPPDSEDIRSLFSGNRQSYESRGPETLTPQDIQSLFSSSEQSSGADEWVAWAALKPVLPEVPKLLRYLGLFMGWQIARLYEANQSKDEPAALKARGERKDQK